MEEKAKKSQGIMLLSVLALLASFIIVILYIVPKITYLKDLANQVSAKQQELDTGVAKVESLKRALSAIKLARAEIETLGVAVPTKEKADEAVAQLSAAASQSGLNLQSVSSGVPDKGFINLTVTCDGNFNSTLAFMGKIENNLRPIKIVDFSLVSSNTSSSISSTFNISLPYIAEAKTTGEAQSNTTGGQNESE